MKARLAPLVAALLLAVPLAHSQSPAPADVAAPANLAEAPVASVSKSDDLANTIAQALIAEPSLKDSKITVQPDENGVILLTGATTNNAQRQKALEIATSHAGSGKVYSALKSGELVISSAAPATASTVPQESVAQENAAASDSTLATASDFVAAPEPAAAPATPPTTPSIN